LYLIKTDSVGDTLWTRTFGSSDRVDFGYTVREASAGHTQSFDKTEADILLIKTDSSGKVNP
jgi:hypothetical protein